MKYQMLVLDLDGTLTNSKKEINSAEDVKGLRIRVMEMKSIRSSGKRWGRIRCPWAWSEAYTAMQQAPLTDRKILLRSSTKIMWWK